MPTARGIQHPFGTNNNPNILGILVAIFFLLRISGIFMIEMAQDLSKYHHPISDIFLGESEVSFALAPEERDHYQEKGYVAGIELLDRLQIDELLSDLSEIMKPDYAADPRFYEYHANESADPSSRLFHVLGAWRVSRAFHDLIFSQPFITVAEQLLGGPVRFWHDQLFVKPARDGAIVAWHQDYSYWTRTKPIAHLTCWIGLDDSTLENGCLHYVPGSHRWDLLRPGDLAADMDSMIDQLTDDQRSAFSPIPIELRAGEASFHHPMMVHGSFDNRSDRPRRAAVINVFRDGVVSDTDQPLLDGIPIIPKGQKIEGRFFPLLTKIG